MAVTSRNAATKGVFATAAPDEISDFAKNTVCLFSVMNTFLYFRVGRGMSEKGRVAEVVQSAVSSIGFVR
jgi:hypothetical protein